MRDVNQIVFLLIEVNDCVRMLLHFLLHSCTAVSIIQDGYHDYEMLYFCLQLVLPTGSQI